jgi:hypothetical protein
MEAIYTCYLVARHFTVLGAYFASVSKAPPPVVRAGCSCFLGLDSPINNTPNRQSLVCNWLLASSPTPQLIRQVAQLIILAALVVHLALSKGKWACAQNEAERMLVAVLFPHYFLP